MKKLISAILSITFLLNISIFANVIDYGEELENQPNQNYSCNFKDVKKSYWAYDYICEMSNRGVLSGYPNGYFYPDNYVTRGEFAKIITVASNNNIRNTEISSFYDVSVDDWYSPYIEASKYYLTGFNENDKMMYYPNSNALREDIAVALVKLKGYDTTGFDLSILKAMFTDWQSISSDAQKYVAVAVEKGLISGYDDNTFRGQSPITRAEAATLLWRAYQYGNGNKVTTDSINISNNNESNDSDKNNNSDSDQNDDSGTDENDNTINIGGNSSQTQAGSQREYSIFLSDDRLEYDISKNKRVYILLTIRDSFGLNESYIDDIIDGIYDFGFDIEERFNDGKTLILDIGLDTTLDVGYYDLTFNYIVKSVSLKVDIIDTESDKQKYEWVLDTVYEPSEPLAKQSRIWISDDDGFIYQSQDYNYLYRVSDNGLCEIIYDKQNFINAYEDTEWASKYPPSDDFKVDSYAYNEYDGCEYILIRPINTKQLYYYANLYDYFLYNITTGELNYVPAIYDASNIIFYPNGTINIGYILYNKYLEPIEYAGYPYIKSYAIYSNENGVIRKKETDFERYVSYKFDGDSYVIYYMPITTKDFFIGKDDNGVFKYTDRQTDKDDDFIYKEIVSPDDILCVDGLSFSPELTSAGYSSVGYFCINDDMTKIYFYDLKYHVFRVLYKK